MNGFYAENMDHYEACLGKGEPSNTRDWSIVRWWLERDHLVWLRDYKCNSSINF